MKYFVYDYIVGKNGWWFGANLRNYSDVETEVAVKVLNRDGSEAVTFNETIPPFGNATIDSNTFCDTMADSVGRGSVEVTCSNDVHETAFLMSPKGMVYLPARKVDSLKK